MKKLISLLMVAVLAFSCTACGTIGEQTGQENVDKTPVISTDFEKYDTSTKEGLKEAIFNAPDYNVDDDFWHEAYVQPVINGFAQDTWVEELSFAYACFYRLDNGNIAAYSNPFYFDANNEYFRESLNAPSNTAYNWLERDWTSFKAFFEQAFDTSIRGWNLYEEEHVVTMEDFYKNINFALPTENIDGDVVKVISHLANINNYNDWCYDNNFIYDRETKLLTTDEGMKNLYDAYVILENHATNYLNAKYLGEELTAPISEYLSQYVDMDITRAYINAQNLSDYNFEITNITTSLDHFYPIVCVDYVLESPANAVSLKNSVQFYYNIVKNADGSYSYEIVYILNFGELNQFDGSTQAEMHAWLGIDSLLYTTEFPKNSKEFYKEYYRTDAEKTAEELEYEAKEAELAAIEEIEKTRKLTYEERKKQMDLLTWLAEHYDLG